MTLSRIILLDKKKKSELHRIYQETNQDRDMLHSLLNKFKEDFPGVKTSVLKNVLVLVVAILQQETVNLYQLKKQVGPVLGNVKSKPAAHYKRLMRLFQAEKESDLWQQLLLFCLKLFGLKVDYLLLDGTSWQFGAYKIHLLVLLMVYKGVAIPICWSNLHKKGTSCVEERKELLWEGPGALSVGRQGAGGRPGIYRDGMV